MGLFVVAGLTSKSASISSKFIAVASLGKEVTVVFVVSVVVVGKEVVGVFVVLVGTDADVVVSKSNFNSSKLI